jgi:hypothetical protein
MSVLPFEKMCLIEINGLKNCKSHVQTHTERTSETHSTIKTSTGGSFLKQELHNISLDMQICKQDNTVVSIMPSF